MTSIRSALRCGTRGGTALACMAILAGVAPSEAVEWVRAAYRPQAVETAEQETWVEWFGRWAGNASSAARR